MRASVAPASDSAGSVRTAPTLSVLMPAYNEAENIAAAIDDVIEHVFAVVPSAELVIVDDGSRDATGAVAQRVADGDPRVRVVTQANAGHGPALVRGIHEARGDWCLLLDSDRQIGLQDFAVTWQLARQNDAVLGVRRRRHDPRHRLVLSRLLRGALSGLLGVHSTDANVPYKLLPRTLALEATAAMPPQPRIPSVLLTVYLHRRGLRIAEQDVQHFARSAGEASLRWRRLIAFCRTALRELLRFHRSLPPRS
ncbi:MAG: glycosyltransferase family 2 protein [Burkholderiales bacterium]|nr:glycosyltransferase family 2 protein [Burkholderiales bacterium]